MTVPTLRPGPLVHPDGALRLALSAGPLEVDPLEHGPRRGRARRWCYAAFADGELAVGVAVVDLGAVGTAFAWVAVDGTTRTWERRVLARRGQSVGPTPRHGGQDRGRRSRVAIDGTGGVRVDVPLDGDGRLVVETSGGPAIPVALATSTPAGGWNVTEKAAGYRVRGRVELDGRSRPVDGGGWRDWTAGRQDRHTAWRWAAGAGTAGDGRRVGLNLSTGMNGAGEGENVVWWDGVPQRLELTTLAPAGPDPAGPWTASGPGWRLDLEPQGVRAADENLLVVRSRYVQPVGRFRGALPGPDGVAVPIDELSGVAEDHRATW